MNQLLAEAHAVIRSEGADLASRLASVEQSTRSLFEDIQALRIERDELLAALKDSEALLSDVLDHRGDGYSAVEHARYAIRKAEGRS